MAVLPILKWPDPRLSTVCSPVGAAVAPLQELIADMFDTMYAAPGRGLAGPQVGAMQRLFVMDVTWKEGARSPVVMIDPEILDRSPELVTGEEGCLSIPGITADVARPDWVVMAWTDATGARRQERLDGFAARCAQHELDHLDGRVTFDRLTPTARALAETRYQQGPAS
ncbi:peptide deformylase [Pseudodonghicola flavimaris]|uniref:Peptide deformylase n=1 Tax=Pseudodonghicola flavimaris TaxID=3050036 RepID=A0ABT7F6K7_9RHOB|nr:peptide deformylase [Pseudodonghicola flavimaris]MDK3020246.1 peptide deformylase [Pseudodonghicola flavimaris]